MYYTIYKTTNLINGKFYLGKHQTENVNDDYLGSGLAIKAAIKKYGRVNFKKEVLFIFDNELEMNAKETELITENLVSDKNTYNKGIGGEGGPHFKGKKHTAESIAKFSRPGRKLSTETKKKIGEANKRRGKMSDETKKKLSARQKERYKRERTKTNETLDI